jgi:hypothetical protein
MQARKWLNLFSGDEGRNNDFAGVGLGRDDMCIWEPAAFGNAQIERFNVLMIPVEQGRLEHHGNLGRHEPE